MAASPSHTLLPESVTDVHVVRRSKEKGPCKLLPNFFIKRIDRCLSLSSYTRDGCSPSVTPSVRSPSLFHGASLFRDASLRPYVEVFSETSSFCFSFHDFVKESSLEHRRDLNRWLLGSRTRLFLHITSHNTFYNDSILWGVGGASAAVHQRAHAGYITAFNADNKLTHG